MLITTIILTLLMAALFSGAETAFLSANKLGVEIERDKGTRRSRLISGFYAHPKQLLSTLMVGNMFVLVIFTWCMLRLTGQLTGGWMSSVALQRVTAVVLSAVIILTFGEYFPKIVFRSYANKALLLVAYPVMFFRWLLYIPAGVLMALSNMLIRYVFRAPASDASGAFTRGDLQEYIEGSLHGDHDEMEAGMFKNALQLKHRRVRECMVPRTEIVHGDIDDGLDALKKIFTETRHSRILISKGDIDNILGYIHHQSFLKGPPDISSMIIPVSHIPEVTNVLEVIALFTRQKHSIAVVVDEFGGTAGIITLEDITEEIVGEIEDEHDEEAYIEEQVSETEFLFSARLEIDYLNEKYPALKFPVGEYETLSGYIVMTSGEIPDQGEIIQMDHFRLLIEKVSDKKIEEVRVFLFDKENA